MVFERIAKLVAEQFGVDEAAITPDTGFEETLNADSLDILELTMSIEEEFGLGEMEDETLEHIRTVGDLAELVSAKMQ